MTPVFDEIRDFLRRLPGLGSRSAERLLLHLFVEAPATVAELVDLLERGRREIGSCPQCGNLSDCNSLCDVCRDPARGSGELCVVESALDLLAIERAGVFKGRYHVLHGKLSPLRGIAPEHLNLAGFTARLGDESISELILALANDIDGEATCHYLQQNCLGEHAPAIRISRIGFGLPSGSGLTFADPATLRSALSGRREF